MSRLVNWLVKSSADPEKVSMTIKGTLLTYVSLVIFVAQSFHVQVSQEWLANLIQFISAFAGSLLMVFGLGRKIYFMFKKDARTTL